MPRIINCSLHRSGTKSFHQWCQQQGLRSLHWPGAEFDDAVGVVDNPRRLWELYRPLANEVDAVSDLPVPLLLPQLLAASPQALYVHVIRPPAAWVQSVRRHLASRDLCNIERLLYWHLTGRRAQSLGEYTDHELMAAYRGYRRQVAAKALAADIRLLELDIDGTANGQVLADLLGLPPRAVPWVGDDQ